MLTQSWGRSRRVWSRLLTTSEVSVVTVWHEDLNSGDVERLVSLSHPDVEIQGPRGTGRGVQRAAETGEATGAQALAYTFVVRNDRVVSVSRYPDLAEALSTADLDESHETRSD